MPNCARCASTENLEIHHVIPRCNGGNNGATEVLCRDCHVQLHAKAGHYTDWGRAGAQAVLCQHGDGGRAFLQEIGALGGRAVLTRYGAAYLQRLARRGGRATAGKDGHLQSIAASGGRATVNRYGRAYMQELGRRGAAARWEKPLPEQEV